MPRFSLRLFLLFSAVAPIPLAWWLPVLWNDDPPGAPTDAEVRQAVKDSGQLLPTRPYQFSKQQIASYVDPPGSTRGGGAQAFHRHFQCTLVKKGCDDIVVYIRKTEWRPVTHRDRP